MRFCGRKVQSRCEEVRRHLGLTISSSAWRIIWRKRLPIPRARRRGDPSDGARVHAGPRGRRPRALGDERRHAHPLGHRARRPPGGRAAPAAGLRRAAQAGRRRGWRRRSRGRRSRPRPWSTRPTSGWSRARRPSGGTAAATSSPRRPRRCAASSSRTPAASGPRSTAAAGSGVDLDERRPRGHEPAPTTSWPSTRPWRSSKPRTRPRPQLVKLRYFAGLDRGGGRERPRHLPRNRPPPLALTPRSGSAASCGEIAASRRRFPEIRPAP